MKKRIVALVDDETYEIARDFKEFVGLKWEDIIKAGIVYWCDELNLKEKLEKLHNAIEELTKQKN